MTASEANIFVIIPKEYECCAGEPSAAAKRRYFTNLEDAKRFANHTATLCTMESVEIKYEHTIEYAPNGKLIYTK